MAKDKGQDLDARTPAVASSKASLLKQGKKKGQTVDTNVSVSVSASENACVTEGAGQGNGSKLGRVVADWHQRFGS
ncbi:uncharacterized protein V6R79_019579 [Siganus canaliculatus]